MKHAKYETINNIITSRSRRHEAGVAYDALSAHEQIAACFGYLGYFFLKKKNYLLLKPGNLVLSDDSGGDGTRNTSHMRPASNYYWPFIFTFVLFNIAFCDDVTAFYVPESLCATRLRVVSAVIGRNPEEGARAIIVRRVRHTIACSRRFQYMF